jgi:hypothetical protein
MMNPVSIKTLGVLWTSIINGSSSVVHYEISNLYDSVEEFDCSGVWISKLKAILGFLRRRRHVLTSFI